MSNLVPSQNELSPRFRLGDSFFTWSVRFSAMALSLLIFALFAVLFKESWLSIQTFGARFLVSDAWNPVTGEYGALTSLVGTLLSTGLALLLAVPVSFFAALFLVELAPPWMRSFVGTGIELLAAIPSIIYGMWGLFILAPLLADHVQPWMTEHLGFIPLFDGPAMGIGLFTAGLVLALMIIPFITSVFRDVLLAVPPMLKESGYCLGATRWEMLRTVMVPYGIRGMVGAVLLGMGRALGETMAVTFVIGNDHTIPKSLFDTGNTISSTLANEFTEAADKLYTSSLVELGLVLFLVTTIFLGMANLWLRRNDPRRDMH